MADLADVENGLVALIADALYGVPFSAPGGVWFATPDGQIIAAPQAGGYLPGSVQATVAGNPAKLYRGWPESSLLDADLAAGTSHVSVFSKPNMTRRTTRYQSVWRTVTPVVPTITAAIVGTTVVFGGTGGFVGPVILTLGSLLQPQWFRYGVQPTDAPQSVAAALAAAVPGASASGSTLTLPSPAVACSVTAAQPAQAEVRRQVQHIAVSCWCPTPLVRDAIAVTIDSALADVLRFTLPDNSGCYVRYVSTMQDDLPSKARVWRRDLTYAVEYPTLAALHVPEMGAGVLNLTQ